MEQEQNPLLPERRGVRNLLIGVGGLSALLGLVVIIGWHTNNLRLIQSTSTSAIMVYNTALSFLLCGVGLIAFALSSLRVVVLCGTLVGAVGLLTLSEYCFGLHLGIDLLFMPDYLQSFFSAHLGRMPASTALCFILAGVAQFVIGWSAQLKFRPPLVGIIGSILLALGMMSQLRYWAGLIVVSEEGWHSLIRPMAFHTAAGFVVLGFGLFVLAWSESRRKAGGMPHWLPASIFVAVSAGTVFLWQALLEEAYMAQTSSSIQPASLLLPTVILLGGSCLAGLLAVAIALAQKERHKTKLLNEINHVLTREIAQHRQTEEALRKQTDIQDAIFACMSEDVIVANAQGEILLMNQAAQQTLGVSRADTPADAPVIDWSRLARIYLPDQHTPFPAEHLPLLRAFQGEMVDECEQFILQPGTSKGVWRSINGRPLRDAEGKICGAITVGRNITERKRIEEALQKQTGILNSILNNMADGVIVADENEKILIFNPAAERIFSKGVTDTRPDAWSQQYGLYLPDMKTLFPTEALPLTQAIRGTAVDKVEMFVRHADAPKGIWAQVSGQPLKDPNGVVKGGVVVCRDITDYKQTEGALRESEERFRSLSAASPVGIFQNDLTGACVYTNARWQEITGLTLEESLGQGWTNAIHSEERESVVTEWQASVAMGRDFAKEFRFVRPTGKVCWVHTQASPLRSDDGIVIGYVGVTMDITERKEVDRLKDEFVSVVSHELRTPLTSIRGSLGLLASGRLGTLQEKGQRMLDIAVTNTDRLVRLINDILDIERIQSGNIAMQKQECNAGDLMTQATEVMRAMAEKAEVTLSVAPYSTRLWADPDRILQTLTNLLSNAIKFSPQGSTVWLTADLQDGHLRFAVKDQGRGIPGDKLDSIFERFQQVNASDSRDKGGTGLGLAICRSIVQQHGGRIGVESTLGGGSVFYFLLPALSHEESAATVTPVPPPQTVLVCDDNRMIGEVVTAMLEHLGYQTVTTTSGPETLHQAARVQPAAILLDLLMPEMDGWETAAALKARPDTRDIPIIILSGLSPQEEGAFPAGVTDWLCKPVEEATLAHALKRALHGQASTACVLVADDDADFAKVLILTLQRHGIESFYARTGQEAIQLSRRLSPDLLILDLFMPEGDGFTVVNWLRQQNNLHHVPLIVYSAKDLDTDERARLTLGPTLFFTKGRVKPEEFERRVIEFLTHIYIRPERRGAA